MVLIEERVGSNHHHVILGTDFLINTSKVQEVKSRINKWNGFKLKSFFSVKEKINKMKLNPHLLLGTKLNVDQRLRH